MRSFERAVREDGMKRVLLFHWNADEAKERLARIRKAGFAATHYAEPGGLGLRALRDDPPRAVVIDLDRLPSQGRAVGAFLRQQRGTRGVPIVFVGGAPEKTTKARALLPDALFTDWDGIRAALREALERPPGTAVVPGVFDAYSGTPLPKKLGFKPGTVAALIGAPRGFVRTLGALPEGARLRTGARGSADLVLLFARSMTELRGHFAAATRALADGGALWLMWPKQASGANTDLTYPIVHAFGVARGFVEYKISAIDTTWSGLRFARAKAGDQPRAGSAGTARSRARSHLDPAPRARTSAHSETTTGRPRRKR